MLQLINIKFCRSCLGTIGMTRRHAFGSPMISGEKIDQRLLGYTNYFDKHKLLNDNVFCNKITEREFFQFAKVENWLLSSSSFS